MTDEPFPFGDADPADATDESDHHHDDQDDDAGDMDR
jgi:hypothetical protein